MKRAVLIGLVGLSIAACGGAKFRAKTQPTIAPDGGGAWIAECRDTVSWRIGISNCKFRPWGAPWDWHVRRWVAALGEACAPDDPLETAT